MSETLIEEERARADQIEEQKSFAELQNELLTELVAAEQVMMIAWQLDVGRSVMLR